ncbi:MAG: DUF3592 domain-containing protein [Opitutae bacterium]|nr:DUF3592 domain-containing protein [Opitutae bacterium]
MKSKENARTSIVIGVILLLISIGILGNICYNLYHSQSSKSWPTVDGSIVSSTIKRGGKINGSGRKYTPVIRYEYEVKGHQFTSAKMAFGLAKGSKGWAEMKVKEYSKGQSVDVRHHPVKHGIAVLETSTSFNPLGLLACPFIAWLGIVLVRYGLRIRRQETEQGAAVDADKLRH